MATHDANIDPLLLRDTLVLLTTGQKNLYLMLSAMLDELAALRETVRGLDPTFSEVMEEKKKKSSEDREKASAVEAQVRSLDELIGKAMRVVYYK
jgi:predicted outer membrane protein